MRESLERAHQLARAWAPRPAGRSYSVQLAAASEGETRDGDAEKRERGDYTYHPICVRA